jgi:hypothetical protein
VDEKTIRNYRESLTSQIAKSKYRTGRDGRTINIENIGKRSMPQADALDLFRQDARRRPSRSQGAPADNRYLYAMAYTTFVANLAHDR